MYFSIFLCLALAPNKKKNIRKLCHKNRLQNCVTKDPNKILRVGSHEDWFSWQPKQYVYCYGRNLWDTWFPLMETWKSIPKLQFLVQKLGLQFLLQGDLKLFDCKFHVSKKRWTVFEFHRYSRNIPSFWHVIQFWWLIREEKLLPSQHMSQNSNYYKFWPSSTLSFFVVFMVIEWIHQVQGQFTRFSKLGSIIYILE